MWNWSVIKKTDKGLITETKLSFLKEYELEILFPRLVKGGYVVVDDYGSSQFPGASTAVNEFLKLNNVSFFYKVPMGACIIVK